jgi:hypothetical protein
LSREPFEEGILDENNMHVEASAAE